MSTIRWVAKFFVILGALLALTTISVSYMVWRVILRAIRENSVTTIEEGKAKKEN